jgi:serine/threonine-protein kinase
MRLVQEKGKVDLPGVVGMESVAAIELLKERGLVPKIVTEEFNNRVGRGRIASQQPAGAMRVKPGAEVRLIVSRGPDSAPMPDLAGLPLPDAQRRMVEQGLRVGTVTEVHAEHHPPGVVIAHEPPAGESAKRGTAVHVLMNAGVSEEVGTMPNLVGQPVRGALARLQGMGVEARISFERAEWLRDSILRQEPPAGGTLRRGQRVVLVVGQ